MSWKSIVITGLLCVVASPVLAAPTMSANLLGLDTAGNWVWEISVDPDQTLFTDPVETGADRGMGGSVAIELGITTTGSRGIVSAAPNLTNFPNPSAAGPPFGNGPAAFPTHASGGTDIDANGARDEGVVFNTTTDRVVAYLGSEFFGSINFGATNGDPKAAFRVHTERPTSTALVTALQFAGAYNADGSLGGSLPLLAQDSDQNGIDDVDPTATVGLTVSKGVRGGNANLSNATDLGDLAILGANYDAAHANPGKIWSQADFTGDGFVDLGDLAVLGANYGTSGLPDPNWTTPGQVNLPVAPGAGGGAFSSVVPEPTSLLLFGTASMMFLLGGRRRSR